MSECERCEEYRRALANRATTGALREILLDGQERHRQEHKATDAAAVRQR